MSTAGSHEAVPNLDNPNGGENIPQIRHESTDSETRVAQAESSAIAMAAGEPFTVQTATHTALSLKEATFAVSKTPPDTVELHSSRLKWLLNQLQQNPTVLKQFVTDEPELFQFIWCLEPRILAVLRERLPLKERYRYLGSLPDIIFPAAEDILTSKRDDYVVRPEALELLKSHIDALRRKEITAVQAKETQLAEAETVRYEQQRQERRDFIAAMRQKLSDSEAVLPRRVEGLGSQIVATQRHIAQLPQSSHHSATAHQHQTSMPARVTFGVPPNDINSTVQQLVSAESEATASSSSATAATAGIANPTTDHLKHEMFNRTLQHPQYAQFKLKAFDRPKDFTGVIEVDEMTFKVWLKKFETFADFCHLDEREKLNALRQYLYDTALEVLESFPETPQTTWSDIVAHLKAHLQETGDIRDVIAKHFGSGLLPMSELPSLTINKILRELRDVCPDMTNTEMLVIPTLINKMPLKLQELLEPALNAKAAVLDCLPMQIPYPAFLACCDNAYRSYKRLYPDQCGNEEESSSNAEGCVASLQKHYHTEECEDDCHSDENSQSDRDGQSGTASSEYSNDDETSPHQQGQYDSQEQVGSTDPGSEGEDPDAQDGDEQQGSDANHRSDAEDSQDQSSDSAD